jgi:hypothetical protein
MPWLRRLFDAWEDYKRQREREALEAAEHEANTYAAMAEFGHDEAFEEDEDSNDDDKAQRKEKQKRKEKRKDKRKRRKGKDRGKHKE